MTLHSVTGRRPGLNSAAGSELNSIQSTGKGGRPQGRVPRRRTGLRSGVTELLLSVGSADEPELLELLLVCLRTFPVVRRSELLCHLRGVDDVGRQGPASPPVTEGYGAAVDEPGRDVDHLKPWWTGGKATQAVGLLAWG